MLETEKQRFLGIFMEAPMSMGVFRGPDHVFEIANPPYLELIGKRDIIGRMLKTVLPELVDQGIVDILDKVYRSGEDFMAREMFVKLEIDGRSTGKYLNFTCHPHRGKHKQVDGVSFFAIDVTEQVLSRKAIEVSELRLNEAQSIAMLGNWEVDFLQGTHYWSDELYTLLGVEKGSVEPSQESFLTFVHPDDLAETNLLINKVSADQEDMNFHCRFIREDGTMSYGYNEWKFKFNEHGESIRLTGILQDVTGSSEAALEIKNSEAFSRGVLDSLDSNIAVIDLSGKLVAVNESWKLFGEQNGTYSQQGSGVGSNYLDVCSRAEKSGDDYAGTACKGITDVMNNKLEIFYFEYPSHSALEERWFGMRVMRFEGKQPFLVISHQDISERKFAEFERTKVAQDLVRRNKDLEQFTYTVRFDQLVEDIRISIRGLIGLNVVKIQYDFSEAENFQTIRSFLYSIFYNLITNSIKYRQQNIPCLIEISSQLIDNKLVLTFSDNSLGIDLGKRGDQVFGLYKRFHSHVEGKGLGLFMVKAQVEKLGGKISVTSEINKGTEFRIEFESYKAAG